MFAFNRGQVRYKLVHFAYSNGKYSLIGINEEGAYAYRVIIPEERLSVMLDTSLTGHPEFSGNGMGVELYIPPDCDLF